MQTKLRILGFMGRSKRASGFPQHRRHPIKTKVPTHKLKSPQKLSYVGTAPLVPESGIQGRKMANGKRF